MVRLAMCPNWPLIAQYRAEVDKNMKRKMTALVIGNADYTHGAKLKNAVNDADDMAAKLRGYGFVTILARDASHREMDKALARFRTLLSTNDIGLFFFAGHGVQVEGSNYLMAVDSQTGDETDAKHSSLALDKVIDVMAKSAAATRIIILDACRNNPWERTWSRAAATRGLASVYAPKGTIIGFATSPGEFASDGAGRNGAYTSALLQHIDEPDCTIETMFKQVRNTVAAETGGKQTSWEHTSLSGNFYFNLSLGRLVDCYRDTALADAGFLLDTAKTSHRIIKGLKSYNWYRQNDALSELTAKAAAKMGINNLFVLGRNIYQAACGGAHIASHFIDNFVEKTNGFSAAKRKSLLDGMLFEVFFDSKAQPRNKIKGGAFNELFALERVKTLRDSFDFISETLLASRSEFYVLPGRGHELAVTVATRKVKDVYRVKAVYIDGVDILRPEDDISDPGDEGPLFFIRRSADELREYLSAELVVPTRLLKLVFTPVKAATGDFSIAEGYTVRKAGTAPNMP